MSDSALDSRTCPKCSAVLPADAAEGLCPRCLMAEAMQPTGPKKAWEPPTAAELGELLPEYDIEKLLGRGGMGAVYKGRQKSLDRAVAIKILSATLDESDQGFAERFKNEARALGKLKHPGIVGVYDFGTAADGLLYIVMEFIDGTDVAKMIAKSGRLHTDHAMAITAHVCDALAYAHSQGIIHRDIKPANIMVGYDGVVQVADFGLAKMTQSQNSGLTQSGMAMGTLHYMAPESLMLGTAVDHRADIYAVGVMLYQMLTGKLPQGLFAMPSLQIKGLDPRYDGIIGKALMEDRDVRYQSINEMRMGLDEILTQPVVKAEAGAGKTPAALNTQARSKRSAAADEKPLVSHHDEHAGKHTFNWQWAVLIALLALGAWEYLRKRPAASPSTDSLVSAGVPEVTPPVAASSPAVSAALTAALAPSTSALPVPAPLSAITPAKATKEQPFVNSLGMKFVSVPGTSVLFCIHETRRQDYGVYAAEVAGVDRTWKEQGGDGFTPMESPELHPVKKVMWEDAQKFCAWLSKEEGRTYRLPTDQEWSSAVGIGSSETWKEGTTPATVFKNESGFPWGDSWPPPKGSGNYSDQSRKAKAPGSLTTNGYLESYDDGFPTTAPVMSFQPNQLGIYDLGGNVWEWCADLYDKTNKTTGKDRVIRGGSWSEGTRNELLSSYRRHFGPVTRFYNRGFRCVLESGSLASSDTGPAKPNPTLTSPSAAVVKPPQAPISTDLSIASKVAPFINTLGMKFVPVPDTKVLFCIHETRRQDYAAYAAETQGLDGSWKDQSGDGFTPSGNFEKHPVVRVSWEDAKKFCAWLSLNEGKTYRLPTDEEWSFAVGLGRAGPPADGTPPVLQSSNAEFPWGGDFPPMRQSQDGNYSDLSRKMKAPNGAAEYIKDYDDGYPTTSPVMSFKTNKFGLYDMGGNVWEWCAEWYDIEKKNRVFRGGSWYDGGAAFLLSSYRDRRPPDSRLYNLGFRCVLEISSLKTQTEVPKTQMTPPPPSAASLLEQQYQAAIARQVTTVVDAYAITLRASYRSALTQAAKNAAASKSDIAAIEQEIQRLDTQDSVPDDDTGANATITKLRTIYRDALKKFRDEKTAPLKAVYEKQQAAAQKPSSVSSSFTADAEGWTVFESNGSTNLVKDDSKGYLPHMDYGPGSDYFLPLLQRSSKRRTVPHRTPRSPLICTALHPTIRPTMR